MAKNKLGRGIETMYRVTYRNHVNLSGIADNKANMLIGINAVLISLILSVVGSGILDTGQSFNGPGLMMLPIATLVLFSTAAMILSVLSARPNVSKNTIHYNPEDPEATKGILFFGNYTGLSSSDYDRYMSDLQSNEKLIYKNMNNDLYNLGLVLQKKFNLLRKAYNTFMIGLVVSILLFFVLFIFSSLS